MFDKFKVKEGEKIKLSEISPDRDKNLSKDELKKAIKDNIKKTKKLQNKLYAESKRSLLIILQALDAGGKDGTIRSVFGDINPQGCRVTSFKVPNEEEKSHDFLWRIHKEIPEKGMIGIFNRSHYEEVLIVRVHDLISKEECNRRYKYIYEFERLLTDQGTKIIKFYLHISKEEQKKRLEERLLDKEKNWKFSIKDLDERKLWDKYIFQFEEVFKNTSTDHAPWFIIPANSNKYRDYIISSIVKETLEKMDPRFPEPEAGIENIVIE